MTGSEKVVAAVVVTLMVLALALPAETVEMALVVQVLVLGVIAVGAGLYVYRIFRGLNRDASEYLWRLIRRDLRVALGLGMLAALAIAVLTPRLDPQVSGPLVPRPWAVLWLVAAIDLFAVGLIDDALVMYRDRSTPK